MWNERRPNREEEAAGGRRKRVEPGVEGADRMSATVAAKPAAEIILFLLRNKLVN